VVEVVVLFGKGGDAPNTDALAKAHNESSKKMCILDDVLILGGTLVKGERRFITSYPCYGSA